MAKTILIVVLVWTSACLHSAPRVGPFDPFESSVQPITFDGHTFCTAFSINEHDGYWATAAHCAIFADWLWNEHHQPSKIEQQATTVVYIDTFWDIAVLSGPRERAWRLADAPAGVGDPIATYGYPYGLAKAYTKGWMAAPGIQLEHPLFGRLMATDLLDMTIAGGNSGGPVLDQQRHVIGIMWGGFTQSSHALSTPWSALKVLAPYWIGIG